MTKGRRVTEVTRRLSDILLYAALVLSDMLLSVALVLSDMLLSVALTLSDMFLCVALILSDMLLCVTLVLSDTLVCVALVLSDTVLCADLSVYFRGHVCNTTYNFVFAESSSKTSMKYAILHKVAVKITEVLHQPL